VLFSECHWAVQIHENEISRTYRTQRYKKYTEHLDWKNLKGGDHLEELEVDEITLK
jgi:hypothetical protein